MDNPNDKPNRYKAIIQIGFSTGDADRSAKGLQKADCKKFLFWTGENISEFYNTTSVKAMMAYRILLNGCCRQFLEEKTAEKMLKDLGFNVEVMPLPVVNDDAMVPMPEKPRWAVDISGDYGPLFGAIEYSLPDVELEIIGGPRGLDEYSGLVHFFPDKSLSSNLKRAALTGRHLVSNVQQPFCGYIDDTAGAEKFIVSVVEKIRAANMKEVNLVAKDYYAQALAPKAFMEAIAC